MITFLPFLRRKLLIPAAIAWALIAVVPVIKAQSPVQLDKHARKMEKRLSRFPKGSYLEFDFRDGSETFGSLGELYDASFQYVDSDNNKTVAHPYADLAQVKKAKEYIGEGSEPHHHVHLLVPALIVAGAAAGGIAAYEVMR
ncbi:MAG: hypothetical protein ABSC62_06885 [Terracidiphilus sp.]|jgi:hypothetical protein